MSDNPPPLDVLSLLDVYVGYANTTIKHAASQFPSPGSSLPAYFPDPWANSHNVMYDGKAWPQFFDSGCVRIDNANPRAVTIGSITVDLPGTECSDYGCRPVHFDRWPRNKVIPPGCKWIITEMEGIPDLFPPAPFPNAVAPNTLFDTSDYNVLPHGTDRSAWLPPDYHDPLITVTAAGKVAIFEDRGHVLDWGGMDIFYVPDVKTEAAQWTQAYRSVPPANLSSLSLSIGQTREFSWTGALSSDGHYQLIPFTPPRGPTVGFLTAVTVTATDADGHPINGVVFAVFAGDTHVGSAITFGNGSATVNFVPTAAGTYSLSAICDGVKSAPVILTVVLPAAVYTAASITAIAAGSSGELYIRWAGLPNPGLCGSNNGWVMIPPNAPQAMKSLAVSLYYNGKPVRIDTAGCVGAYERVTALYSPGS